MAGKGDMPRPCDRKRYEAGYDQIDWSRGKNKDKAKLSEENVFEIVPLPPGDESYFCHLDLAKGESQSAIQKMYIPPSVLMSDGRPIFSSKN